MQAKSIIASVLLALGLLSIAASAYAAATPEYVKAAMIRKFSDFIKWPEDVSPRKDMHVRICVYGDSPMVATADIFTRGLSSQSMHYSLAQLPQLSSAATLCHILFISSTEQENMGMITAMLKNKPVLTIGDMKGFAEKGGMIGFQVVDGRMRYNINNKALDNAQLKVDAQLLETANNVVD